MKIISKFKDYYDYVAHQYGEGDPLIRYERKDLDNNDFQVKGRLPFNFYYKNNIYKDDEDEFNLLIVMNNAYFIYKNKIYNYNDELINKKLFARYITWDETNNLSKDKETRYKQKLEILKNKYRNKSISFSKAVNQPVFILNRTYKNGDRNYINVDHKIPNLGKLGFASIMSPEQLYQELAFFIGNILKTPEPIITVSNKDKILQAGFDLKTSFRGK